MHSALQYPLSSGKLLLWYAGVRTWNTLRDEDRSRKVLREPVSEEGPRSDERHGSHFIVLNGDETKLRYKRYCLFNVNIQVLMDRSPDLFSTILINEAVYKDGGRSFYTSNVINAED